MSFEASDMAGKEIEGAQPTPQTEMDALLLGRTKVWRREEGQMHA